MIAARAFGAGLFTVFLLVCAGAPEQPNFLLITLDTTRADHFGCYGYYRPTSQNLDAFAAESILFERCIAPMATTLPTHVSILTSTYPIEHGVLSNKSKTGNSFAEGGIVRSFASYCSDAGYRTGAFVSAAPLKKHTGIQEGFGHFDQPEGAERPAGETTDRALAWLADSDSEPFFLWIHYFDPHFPYEAPPPFDTLFRNDASLDSLIEVRKAAISGFHVTSDGVKTITSREAINGYDREIRYLDDQLARVFRRLDESTAGENTAILIVGDHGEGLCQHGMAGHGGTPNEQLWVPMIIRAPGVKPSRLSGVVSPLDGIPTLLSLVSAPGLEGFIERASGRNAIDGNGPPAFSQDTGYKIDEPDYRHTLTGDRWKYVRMGHYTERPQERLFDLAEDPHELREVRREHPEVVRRMRDSLESILHTQEGRRFEEMKREPDEVDSTIIEQLRSLGYVDD